MALSTQVRASSGSAFPWKYDVFLSFRGEDIRKGFIDYLYHELDRHGIRTFRDDRQLERDTAISLELLTAIEQSRFAIVVLSPNYATSMWCLLELFKIFQCMEERGTILPIFYEVDPSHVRHQRGSFAKAFEEHDEKFGDQGNMEVERWRDALTKVANLAGWTSRAYRYETQLIREIVQALWSKVHPSLMSVRSDLLGSNDTSLTESLLHSTDSPAYALGHVTEDYYGSISSAGDTNYNESSQIATPSAYPSSNAFALSIREDGDLEDTHSWTKITSLDCILFFMGIGLEVLSVVFDQLSSPQKHRYALMGMLCANVAVLLCILELILKGITKGGSQNNIRSFIMEMLPEITGLGIAIFQSISSAVQFYYYSRHADNLLKASLVGIYIGLCLFLLKLRNQ